VRDLFGLHLYERIAAGHDKETEAATNGSAGVHDAKKKLKQRGAKQGSAGVSDAKRKLKARGEKQGHTGVWDTERKLKLRDANQGQCFGGECQREGNRMTVNWDDVEAGDLRE
jgi:hypothetical protein